MRDRCDMLPAYRVTALCVTGVNVTDLPSDSLVRDRCDTLPAYQVTALCVTGVIRYRPTE